MSLKADVGLEVHVQLKTRTKMFCGCATSSGDEPNTNVCPVCLGYPGALPVMNGEAIRMTVMSVLMIGCRINLRNKFDRKNYFYPDQAKNYQITQFDEPLCIGGHLDIALEDGSTKRIGITRIHLEEDVAKNTHFPDGSGVDFNRGGTPLMEIVTEPDMANADEAMAFLLKLKQILEYGGVSDCDLEKGNMRCDVNSSVREIGAEKLGTKVEIKNMNTFKGVHRALSYEIQRQMREVSRGGMIIQETRRWDDAAGVTESMRTKERAHDYRYFPEPDLLPVELTQEQVDSWAKLIPELPELRRARLVSEYGIPDYDAGVLSADRPVADFFEATAKACGNGKAASNWVMTEILRVLSEAGKTIADLKFGSGELATLIKLVDSKAINMPGAKIVFAELLENGGDPAAIVKAKGLAQVSDSGAIEAFADQAISANPGPVADFKAGKAVALQFLVGQVMKLSKGKANPAMAKELLEKKLKS